MLDQKRISKARCKAISFDVIFADPPNVRIENNVSGLGEVQHSDFAMASAEMTQDEFTTFLTEAFRPAAARLRDGGIAFICMDWRQMTELQQAGMAVFDELKNVCIWNKKNAGMGAFYRSKYELVFVFRKGDAPHTNTFGLGGGGRHRANVWDYAGGIDAFQIRPRRIGHAPDGETGGNYCRCSHYSPVAAIHREKSNFHGNWENL